MKVIKNFSVNSFTSPGERRAVTPGTAITRPTENICGNSTCPKTPQSGFLEEAKAVPAESIRPDRSRTVAIAHVLANQPCTYFAVYRYCVKTASLFDGSSNRSPSLNL